jgi:hypothetical protein
MRRLIALLLVVVFLGTLAACDGGGPEPVSQPTPTAVAEAEPTEAVDVQATEAARERIAERTQTALVRSVKATVIASQQETVAVERTEVAAGLLATQVVRDATATVLAQVPPTPEPTPEPPPTVAPTAATTLTFEGQSARKTEPFTLSAGTYKVDYKLTNAGNFQCFTAAVVLHNVNEKDPNMFTGERITSDSVPEGQTLQQTTYIYNVATGTYYIDADTRCTWTITITKV